MGKLVAFFISLALVVLAFAAAYVPGAVTYGVGTSSNARISEPAEFASLLSSVNTYYGTPTSTSISGAYTSTTLDASSTINVNNENSSVRLTVDSTFYITEHAVLVSGKAEGYISVSQDYYQNRASVYFKEDISLYIDSEKELANIRQLTAYMDVNSSAGMQHNSLVFPTEYRDSWILLDQSFDNVLESAFGFDSLSSIMDLNMDYLNYLGNYFLSNRDACFDTSGRVYTLRSAYWNDFLSGMIRTLASSVSDTGVKLAYEQNMTGLFSVNLSNSATPKLFTEFVDNTYFLQETLTFSNINNTVVTVMPNADFVRISDIRL